ncbi:MAG: MBL fold metallo-hydrolase [Myxococcota bacterium]|nr:MBL fold metallo-hydrolase [Myxococcota bacterium]
MRRLLRRLALLPVLAIALGLAVAWATGAPPAADEAGARDGERAELFARHRDEDGRFFNPWGEDENRSFWRVLQWQLFDDNPWSEAKADPPRIPVVANDGASLAAPRGPDEAALTWVGHATFAVEDGDQVFLTDPHWGERALVVPREVPPGIPLEAVPDDAFAVVSHNHYDHLDEWTVENLPGTVAWYVPLGHGGFFRERGRPVVELDWWESARHGRFTVTCLPSQHWSRRITVPTNAWLWCSWLVDSGTRRYYFAGDTGYFHGFEAFGERFGPIDVALLPIGAYEPRWFMKYQHVNPEEAYDAFLDLRARLMVGMHWGTFDLTDEPLDLPPRELARVVAARGADPQRVRVLAVGERLELPPPVRAPRVERTRGEEPARRAADGAAAGGG